MSESFDSSRVEEVYRRILDLTPGEVKALRDALGGEWGIGGAGVREPREPGPESPGDAVAVELPEDYWETAQ